MTRSLTPRLNPKSIVFVGGNECEVAIRRTRELGFAGKIWAVNPKREQLGGIPCVNSVTDIDGVPDAAFVAVKIRAIQVAEIFRGRLPLVAALPWEM